MRQPKVVFKYAVIAAIVSNLIVFISIYFGWFGVAQGVGNNFCEATRNGLIKQPANSFSNIGFIIAGLTGAYQLSKGKFIQYSNILTKSIFFPSFLLIGIILLGPGSIAMHATETSMGGYFDMLSMYLIAAIMFTFAVKRYFKLSIPFFIAVFIGVLVVCHIFNYITTPIPVIGSFGSFIFGVFIISGMLFEFLHARKDTVDIESKWALAASLTFIVSFAIWTIGWDDHPWCRPNSLLQAHAIWHMLDALAAYFLFRLYVSENSDTAIA
ncbi:MAG: ceramidase domain-containing protein [Chitinophagales bacterium]